MYEILKLCIKVGQKLNTNMSTHICTEDVRVQPHPGEYCMFNDKCINSVHMLA